MTTETIARPFNDQGQLFAGGPEPLAPKAVFEQTLDPLTQHLERVAWWPKAGCGSAWQIGDFSFYVLEFPASETALLYAQVWSEPGEGVIVEVSSGAWTPPSAERISEAQREALLNRGFETGGRAGNYRKVIHLERSTDCRRLARELIAVLIECLGYDGRAALSYRLHLGRRTQTAQVFKSLTFDDFGRLLKSWGFLVDPVVEGNRHSYRVTGGPPFVATLQNESSEHPGEFDGFTLGAFATLAPGVLAPVAEELQRALPFASAHIDADGDLAIRQLVYLGGGVTEAHLRQLMKFWRGVMEVTQAVIQKHSSKTDTRVLN